MALTDSGKKLLITGIAALVLIGGYVGYTKHKASTPVAPATTQEQTVKIPAQTTSDPDAMAVKSAAEKNGVKAEVVAEPVKEEAAPVKKKSAGHVAKHAPAKHHDSTKSTPTLSGSTHTRKTMSDDAAVKELSNQGGF